MCSDLVKTPGAISDGLDGEDADDVRNSLIKGSKLKYKDGGWVVGKQNEPFDTNRELTLARIFKFVQKWLPGHNSPVENEVFDVKEHLPDVEELNAQAPKSEWREAFGKQVGPFEAGYLVYLLDDKTMEFLTFIANTTGGGIAARDLRERAKLARQMRGPTAIPIVRLSSAHMPTAYGGRERPAFEIVRISGETEPPAQIEVEPKPSPTGPISQAEPAPKPEPEVSGPSKVARSELSKLKSKLSKVDS